MQGGRDFRPFVGAADCLGIVLEFLHRIGIEATDPWDVHSRAWQAGSGCVMDLVPPGWREVTDDDKRVLGDVGETNDGRHVCVYVGGGFCLHSARSRDSFLFPLNARGIEALRAKRWWRWTC